MSGTTVHETQKITVWVQYAKGVASGQCFCNKKRKKKNRRKPDTGKEKHKNFFSEFIHIADGSLRNSTCKFQTIDTQFTFHTADGF